MRTTNFSKTGDRCPRSGEWFTLGDNSSSVYLKRGEEMPSYKGRSVNWQIKTGI